VPNPIGQAMLGQHLGHIRDGLRRPSLALLVMLAPAFPVWARSQATAAWSTEGDKASAFLGAAVATAGDVNDDGYADVLVGAYGYDVAGIGASVGRAMVFLGSGAGLSPAPGWIEDGELHESRFGTSVASAGDVNGDGFDDLIIGAPTQSPTATAEGRAFLYLGSALGPSADPDWSTGGTVAGARLGQSVSSAGDVNGDGYDDVIIGAYTQFNGDGRLLCFHGSSTGLNTSPAWTIDSNSPGALLGYSVACAGDVNGDSYSDVIVGAVRFTNGQGHEGAAFVYHGSATGLSTTPAWMIESNQASAFYGAAVASAGDVNGDGFSDVIVGASDYETGQGAEGRAFVYFGSQAGLSPSPSWATEGNQATAFCGVSVSGAGDLNGDGYSDIVVGGHGYANGENDEGRAWIYLGSPSGPSSAPAFTVEADQVGANLGSSVASAGNIDNDGYDDLVVGCPAYDNGHVDEGIAFLFQGASVAASTLVQALFEQEVTEGSGGFGGDLDNGDIFGGSVAPLGEFDGDGVEDLVVGAPYDDDGGTLGLSSNVGAMWILLLNPDGSVKEEKKISATSGSFAGSLDDGDLFGTSVAGIGDLDFNGSVDLVVGAQTDDGGRGSIWVVKLQADGTVVGQNKIPSPELQNDEFGVSVEAIGDLDQDGVDEVAVGAYLDDGAGTNRGALYILFLNGDGTLDHAVKIGDTTGGLGSLDDNDEFGRSVAWLGDLDGAGGSQCTLAVGSSGNDSFSGAMWILSLSASGTVDDSVQIKEGQGLPDGVLDPGDVFGVSVEALGSIGGPGVIDVAVGAYLDDVGSTGEGTVWVLSLNADGSLADYGRINSVEGSFGGALGANDGFGLSLGALGDLDGDGRVDLAVGAQDASSTTSTNGTFSGSTWLIHLNNGTLALGSGATTWTGATDAQWELAGNWGNGTPDLTKTAIIPDAATTPNDPIVSAVGQECLSLWMQPDAALNIASSADHLGVYGGATVFGPITGTGQLRFEAAGTLAGSETIGITGTPAVLAVEDLELQGGPLSVTGDFEGDAGVLVAAGSVIDIGGFVDVATDLSIDGSLTVGDGVDVAGTLESTAGGDLTVNGTGVCVTAGQLCFHGDITTSCSLGVQNFTPDPTEFDAASGWPASVSIDVQGTMTLFTQALEIAGDLVLVEGTFAVGVDGFLDVGGTNGIVIEGGATLDITGFQTLVLASAPITVQSGGKLNIGAGGELLLESNVLTIEGGGLLCLDGVEQSQAALSGFLTSRYTLTLDPGSRLAAKGFVFRQMSPSGIVIGPGVLLEPSPYDLRGGTFDLPADNGVLLDLQRSVPTTLRYLVFDDSDAALNPTSIRSTAGASLTFVNWSGDLAPDATIAETHDDDPAEPLDRVVFGPPEASDVQDFTARWASDHIKVRWQTLAEVDSAGFLLQRAPYPVGAFVDLATRAPQGPSEYGHDDFTVAAQAGYRYRLYELLTHGARRLIGEVALSAASAPDVLFPVWGNTAPPVPPLPLVVGPSGPYPDVPSAIRALGSTHAGDSIVLTLEGVRHAAFELGRELTIDLVLVAEPGAVIDASLAPLRIRDLPPERTLELDGLAIDSGGAGHPALELEDVHGIVLLQDLEVRGSAQAPAVRLAGSTAVILQGGRLDGTLLLERGSRATTSATEVARLDLRGRSTLETRASEALATIELGSTHLAHGPAPTLALSERRLTLTAPTAGLAWLSASPRLAFRPLAGFSSEGLSLIDARNLVTLPPQPLRDGHARWSLGALPLGTTLCLQGAILERGTGRLCLTDVRRMNER